MNARPILFSGPMVRALREGRKTQTRRIVPTSIAEALDFLGGGADGEPATSETVGLVWNTPIDDNGKAGKPQWLAYCSEYPEEGSIPIGEGYGQPGDLLWVRETWGQYRVAPPGVVYRADDDMPCGAPERWRPSIHMPRWASRLTLRIKSVRVERLQEISEADAKAEGWSRRDGVSSDPQVHIDAARDWFGDLWESINGPGSWSANPWVWVIEFDVIQANVDQVLREAA